MRGCARLYDDAESLPVGLDAPPNFSQALRDRLIRAQFALQVRPHDLFEVAFFLAMYSVRSNFKGILRKGDICLRVGAFFVAFLACALSRPRAAVALCRTRDDLAWQTTTTTRPRSQQDIHHPVSCFRCGAGCCRTERARAGRRRRFTGGSVRGRAPRRNKSCKRPARRSRWWRKFAPATPL